MDIATIPLNQLFASASNLRKAPATKAPLEELKASIRAHGLLENLVVRPGKAIAEGHQRYYVIAGGRRLGALQELASDGAIAPDTRIPCKVLAGDEPAEEISLAENVARVAMHPADQVAAFASLIEAGSTIDEIATRFGFSKKLVEQRLRLGQVAPPILDAFRKDRIDLKCVMAFTMTQSHERQIAVFKQASDNNQVHAWAIKRILSDDRVALSEPIARYVGKKAYRAAGGTISEDLFSDQHETDTWFNDAKLVHDLAHKKLSQRAKGFRKKWKWVEVWPVCDWDARHKLGTIDPAPDDLTDDETETKTKLEAELEALPEDEHRRGWEIRDALGRIRLAALKRGTHTEDRMAVAGVVVTLDHAGKVEIIKGAVKPEDKRAAAKVSGDDESSEGETSGGQSDAGVRKEEGVGKGLADDLRHLRNNIVKAHLAESFPEAFDLATYQFARSVLGGSWYGAPLDIKLDETASYPQKRNTDKEYQKGDAAAKLLDFACKQLPLGWFQAESTAEQFEQFRALPTPSKQLIFAACIAKTLKGQLAFEKSARPETEQVIATLGIDFPENYRPGAQYWSQIPKGKIVEIAVKVLADETHRQTSASQMIKTLGKLKKAELVEYMTETFAAPAAPSADPPVGLTKAQHERALAWTPPGFPPSTGWE